MNSYGEKIRKLREEFGLSQSELAQKLGVHKQMISDIERGKQKRFNPQVERKLMELFGLQNIWFEELPTDNNIEAYELDSLNAEEQILIKYFRYVPENRRLQTLACLLQCLSRNSIDNNECNNNL